MKGHLYLHPWKAGDRQHGVLKESASELISYFQQSASILKSSCLVLRAVYGLDLGSMTWSNDLSFLFDYLLLMKWSSHSWRSSSCWCSSSCHLHLLLPLHFCHYCWIKNCCLYFQMSISWPLDALSLVQSLCFPSSVLCSLILSWVVPNFDLPFRLSDWRIMTFDEQL